jgi:RimJ/RimL family protein N-acetyltransferase
MSLLWLPCGTRTGMTGSWGAGGTSEAGPRAEVAFLIDDAHQGLGLGSRIFKHLVTIARASGITQFEAEVLPGNRAMLALFARSGLPMKRHLEEGAVHVTLSLSAPAP